MNDDQWYHNADEIEAEIAAALGDDPRTHSEECCCETCIQDYPEHGIFSDDDETDAE